MTRVPEGKPGVDDMHMPACKHCGKHFFDVAELVEHEMRCQE